MKTDRDYWLANCHGFSVTAAGRRLGIVEDILFLSRIDCPDSLVLRSGSIRLQRTLVPVTTVEQIRPRSRQIVLAATASPTRQKQDFRLPRLLDRLLRATGAD